MTSIRGRRQTINSLLLKNTKKVVIRTDGTIMVSYEKILIECQRQDASLQTLNTWSKT